MRLLQLWKMTRKYCDHGLGVTGQVQSLECVFIRSQEESIILLAISMHTCSEKLHVQKRKFTIDHEAPICDYK